MIEKHERNKSDPYTRKDDKISGSNSLNLVDNLILLALQADLSL